MWNIDNITEIYPSCHPPPLSTFSIHSQFIRRWIWFSEGVLWFTPSCERFLQMLSCALFPSIAKRFTIVLQLSRFVQKIEEFIIQAYKMCEPLLNQRETLDSHVGMFHEGLLFCSFGFLALKKQQWNTSIKQCLSLNESSDTLVVTASVLHLMSSCGLMVSPPSDPLCDRYWHILVRMAYVGSVLLQMNVCISLWWFIARIMHISDTELYWFTRVVFKGVMSRKCTLFLMF